MIQRMMYGLLVGMISYVAALLAAGIVAGVWAVIENPEDNAFYAGIEAANALWPVAAVVFLVLPPVMMLQRPRSRRKDP